MGFVQCCGFLPGQGFLRDNRVFTTLDSLDGLSTIPTNINTRGPMVSIYSEVERPPPDGFFNGFSPGLLSDHKTFTPIDVPSSTFTQISGIDDAGQSVGIPTADVRRHGHGFVVDDGVFTTIDAPHARLFTVVFGISNDGATMGGDVDTRGRQHRFLRTEDTLTLIDVPGAAATFAAQINAQGQIVGISL
jgi:uncharacterized membrane protein